MEVIQLVVRTPGTGSSGWGLVRAGIRLMTSGDLDQARRRMRFAWIAGFIWVGISLFSAVINALGLFFGWDAEGQPWWSGGQLAFVLAESTLMASLSLGVLKRGRPAAVLLFLYFGASRLVLIALGVTVLQEPSDVLRFLLIETVVAYLLFQGMRGSLVFHLLTHSQRPAAAAMPEAPDSKE